MLVLNDVLKLFWSSNNKSYDNKALEENIDELDDLFKSYGSYTHKTYLQKVKKLESVAQEEFRKINRLVKDKESLQERDQDLIALHLRAADHLRKVHYVIEVMDRPAKRQKIDLHNDVISHQYINSRLGNENQAGSSGGICKIQVPYEKGEERTLVLKHVWRMPIDNEVAYPGLHGFLKEREFLKEFHHRNVLAYIDSGSSFAKNDRVQDPLKGGVNKQIGESQPIDFGEGIIGEYVVLEYADGNTLAKKLNPNGENDGEAVALPVKKLYALEILEGLKHIHKKHIVHLDIKADNVLIANTDSPFGIVKICDFDCAQKVDGKTALEKAGTPARMAPELKWDPAPGLGKDPREICKMDYWSAGILIAEMLVPDYVQNVFLPAYLSMDERDDLYLNELVKGLRDHINVCYDEKEIENLTLILTGLLQPLPEERTDLALLIDHLKADLGMSIRKRSDLRSVVEKWLELAQKTPLDWKLPSKKKGDIDRVVRKSERIVSKIIQKKRYIDKDGTHYHEQAKLVEMLKDLEDSIKIVKEDHKVDYPSIERIEKSVRSWRSEIEHPPQSLRRRYLNFKSKVFSWIRSCFSTFFKGIYRSDWHIKKKEKKD